MANPAQKVFVCHSSADKVIAREIAEGLRQLGFDSWFDDWEIKLGDSLVEQLNEGLDAAGAFIILFSKNAAASRWVQEETNAALIKRIRKDARIIPVRLDKTELPPLLSSLRYATVRESADVRPVLDEIARALLDEESGPPVAPLLRHGPSGRPIGVPLSDHASAVLAYTARRANDCLSDIPEADEVMEAQDLTADAYREAVQELEDLEFVISYGNANHASGYARAAIKPYAFVRVASQVEPEVNVAAELRQLLECFESADRGIMLTHDIVRQISVPIPRAQILFEFLGENDIVSLAFGGGQPGSLSFHRAELRPRGRRILRGLEPMPLA